MTVFKQNYTFSQNIAGIIPSGKSISSLSVISKPSWLTIDSNTLQMTGTTPENQTGTWNIQFNYTLDDNTTGSHALLVSVATQPDAQISTLGGSIVVNTNTKQGQMAAQLVTLSDGNYMCIWRDETAGGSGARPGLVGQILDSDFEKIGGEFGISPTANSSGPDNKDRDLVALSEGGVIVVWNAYGMGESGPPRNIAAQKIDNSGNLVGSHIVVNSDTSASQVDAKVCLLNDGNLLITWRDFDSCPSPLN